MKKYFAASLIAITIVLSGCLVVKHEEEKEKPIVINLSPQPEMPMSDLMVRSESGDMLSFLPQGWSLLNTEDKAPSDVIAVAVNPEYTMTVVFSHIDKKDRYSEIVGREGLTGLARIALEERTKKTGGSVHQLGKYSTIHLGPRTFAKYEFANSDNTMRGVAAVFRTTLDDYYEMSVVPVNLTGIVAMTKDDVETVFNSVLSTIQY